jgi:hypothetical protein
MTLHERTGGGAAPSFEVGSQPGARAVISGTPQVRTAPEALVRRFLDQSATHLARPC